jgi:hypothetical protein
MANITSYLKNLIVEQSLAKSPTGGVWPYSQTFVGLFVQSPTESFTNSFANTGYEIAAADYSRIQLTWDNTSLHYWINDSGIMKNATDLTWTSTVGSNWAGSVLASEPAPIVAVGVFGSIASTAPLLWYGPLSNNITVANGDTFTIGAHSLAITLT